MSIPQLDRVAAAWDYGGAARSLVLDLKLRGDRSAAGPLVDAMHAVVLRRGLASGVITWVPARPRDIRMRGFDHAEVLARGLAARLGVVARPLLQRTGSSADQTSLTADQRWSNLAGAFSAPSCRGGVAIVDDLVTTGATVSACAGALRGGGADRVEAIAACYAARTGPFRLSFPSQNAHED